MKMVIIEPLGVPREILLFMADKMLKDRVEIIYYDTKATDTDELIKRGKDADIIVVSNLPLNSQVIEGCKSLKAICVAFTGVDHIAMETCRNNNILVCNCAGYSTAAVADLTFGMVISLYRHLQECNSITRKCGTKDGLIGYELENKKFGVVGTGAIGMRVASIAKAFGCEVYAYSRTVKDVDYINYVDLDTLMSTCDIISLHVPLNDNTRHMINDKNINLMKKNAILINTARGPVVDSNALAYALNNDVIAGAGIDVFENEPPIDSTHPLLNCKNCIVTPHVAFATNEALIKRAKIVFDNVKNFIDGTPKNIV